MDRREISLPAQSAKLNSESQINSSSALLTFFEVWFCEREIFPKGIGVDPVGQPLGPFHRVGKAVKGDGWRAHSLAPPQCAQTFVAERPNAGFPWIVAADVDTPASLYPRTGLHRADRIAIKEIGFEKIALPAAVQLGWRYRGHNRNVAVPFFLEVVEMDLRRVVVEM